MSPGFAVSPDGSRLYVYDGNREGELLVIELADWQKIYRQRVTQVPQLIFENPLSLSGDGRWLLVQRYNYDTNRRWTSVFDTRELRFRPDAAALLQIPQGLKYVRMEGRPGHAQVYANLGGSVAAFDSESLTELWRAPTPLSRDPGLVLAPDGRFLYGLYPEVTEGCPCPEGHVHVTKMSIHLFVWAASTGKLVNDAELTERLAVPLATIGRGDRGFLAIAPSGSILYVVWENMLWALSTDSLTMIDKLTLPAPADGLAQSIDGNQLYMVPATGGIRNPATGLWTVDATSLRLIRLAADWPQMSIPSLLVVPAP